MIKIVPYIVPYIVPCIVGTGAFVFGVFFIFYGIKGGFIDKRILVQHPNYYVTGKEAVTRGIFYIILGVLFLVGCSIIVIYLIKKSG